MEVLFFGKEERDSWIREHDMLEIFISWEFEVIRARYFFRGKQELVPIDVACLFAIYAWKWRKRNTRKTPWEPVEGQ